MSGRIIAHGPDEPHRCRPQGDRTRTFKVPLPPPVASGATTSSSIKPLVHSETYARPGDVYECDCGKTWIACAEVVRDLGVWGHGGYRAARGYDWRREGRWARRRRLKRSAPA